MGFEESVDRNTRHLLMYWAVALVFGSVALVGVVGALVRGDYLVPCVVTLVLAVSIAKHWFRTKKLTTAFQERSAAPAVGMFRKSARLPHGRLISASLCAVAFALYGNFDEARDELNSVSVHGVPPIYEAMHVYALAVLALLEERNYRKASELAAEMRDLCSVNAAVPGSKRTRRATDAFCDACALLAGSGTSATAERLSNVVGKLRPIDTMVVAWALGQYFSRAGDAGRAGKYRAMVRKLAPHCTPLNEERLA